MKDKASAAASSAATASAAPVASIAAASAAAASTSALASSLARTAALNSAFSFSRFRTNSCRSPVASYTFEGRANAGVGEGDSATTSIGCLGVTAVGDDEADTSSLTSTTFVCVVTTRGVRGVIASLASLDIVRAGSDAGELCVT